MQIPKIIWQTHEWEYSDLPVNFKRATMTWKNLNVSWDYKYVSAIERAKQVEAIDPFMYIFYEASDNTTQADIWRYMILREQGGVYADMDSVCSQPLDYEFSFIPKDVRFICTEPDHRNFINNANFASEPKDEILERVLENILDNIYLKASLLNILELVRSGYSAAEAIKYKLSLDPEWYSKTVNSYLDNRVWSKYSGSVHTQDVKDEDFMPNHLVNHYGELKEYLTLASDNNWSLD